MHIKQRSFSLLEILIAAVVFVLMALPLMSLMKSSSRNTYVIEKKLSSLYFAESIMEFMTSFEYTDLPPIGWKGDLKKFIDYVSSFSPPPKLLNSNQPLYKFFNLYPDLKLTINILGSRFIDDVNHVFFEYKLVKMDVAFKNRLTNKTIHFKLTGLVKK